MANRETFKTFNSSCKEYFMHRNEDAFNNIQKSLQIMSVVDSNIYDAGNRDVVEFFINLHELLSSVEPSSHVSWLAVNVLLVCCQNFNVRDSLIHTYKFASILSKILVKQDVDKRPMILQLMKELTYGIKITWQEAYLPSLINTLTSYITSDDSNLLSVSLGVLVNLCYQNMPSVYTLLRTVNIKKFLKTLLKIQKQYDHTRIEISKLLIILQGVSDGLPDQEVHVFTRMVFPTLADAFQNGNFFMMRHQVNFFQESIKNPRTNTILQSYNFKNDIELLLSKVKEDKIKENCLGLLFEFLTSLVDLENVELEFSYPSLVDLSLSWLRTSSVSTESLNLLFTVVRKINKNEKNDQNRQIILNEVSERIYDQISVIMLLFDISECDLGTNESYKKFTALFSLLSEMVTDEKFSNKILSSLSQDQLRQLFLPFKKPDMNDSCFFQEGVYSFCVQALLFLSILAEKEATWLLLYSELLQEKHVQFLLSVALFTGNENIKKKALSLFWTRGFTLECMNALASSMVRMNKLVVFSPQSRVENEEEANNGCGLRQVDLVPLLSGTQETYLTNLLENYERSSSKNNIMTSSIIELYQFKIAALNQTIRHMQSSQEAADRRATSLTHSLARTSSEVSQLHSVLLTCQQSLETTAGENNKLRSQISEIETQANETHNKYKQLLQTLRTKTLMINELEEKCKEFKSTVAQKDLEIERVKKISDETIAKLQEEKLAALQNEKTIEALKKELNENRRIREMINELATGKGKLLDK